MSAPGNSCPILWRKPVSLWDIMKPFIVKRFQGACWLLGFIQGTYDAFPDDRKIVKVARDSFAEQLMRIRVECEELGLPVSVEHLTDEIHSLRDEGTTAYQIAKSASGLSDTIRREMESTKMFRLHGETQKYYEKEDAFGPKVAEAFPGAEYDIKEAGNCLALNRGTASVFHSMRVLEHALRALASQFNVPTNHKAWGEMLKGIEDGIGQIPRQQDKPSDWREYQQFCAEAASQFMHFKTAWRNYTAHARTKYTEEEGEQIFRHVGDFMKHISKRLKEPVTNP